MVNSTLPAVMHVLHHHARMTPWVILSASMGVGLFRPASAEIIPDGTLGSEASQVVETRIGNLDSTRIEGGAIRGSHLFHSFLEFNVDEGRGAYFSNPAGIEAILGRVTGDNRSDIFGTLGVLGNADLFLLNPNGFIFGENARLDVRGSFVASTADRFDFPDGSSFSAVNPDSPPLLTVALTPGLQSGGTYRGPVTNHAALTVDPGQTLTLGGTITTHTGTLTAPGGTIHVLGDQVNLLGDALIDVSSDSEGGNIFVGGDLRGVGSLPQAQRTVVAPGVTLRADALTAGNGGQIVVWADGLTQFYGNISARGGVQGGDGGFAEVSGKQHLVFNGHADLSAPQGALGTLLLDPENILITDDDTGSNDMDVLDGEILADDAPGTTSTISEAVLETLFSSTNIVLEATNDITINALADGELDLTGTLSSADPTAPPGTITFTADADGNGVGSFTMVDTSDRILTGGRDLTITGATIIPGSINSEGGMIVLAASDRLVLNDIDINSGGFDEFFFSGFSGDIELTAGNDILITNATITSDGSGGGEDSSADAGDIIIQSTNGSVLLDASELSSTAFIEGFAGNVEVTAGDRLSLTNDSTIVSNFESSGFSELGGAGLIELTAGNDVAIASGSQVSADSFGSSIDTTSGNIVVTAQQGSITLDGAELSTSANGSGFAGDINLTAGDRITLANSSTLFSDAEGEDVFDEAGGAGFITLTAVNDVAIASGSRISAESFGGSIDSNAGDISVTTQQGSIAFDGAALSTSVDGSGFAGNIILTSGDGITLQNESRLFSDALGDVVFDEAGGAGFITLTAVNDVAIASSSITAESFEGGADSTAGDLSVTSQQGSIWVDNATLSTRVSGSGFAGNITLEAGDQITLQNSTALFSDAEGFGENESGGAGLITVTATHDINLERASRISAEQLGGTTDSTLGDIRVQSQQGSVTVNNGSLSTSAEGSGFAGNITLEAGDSITLLNDSRMTSDASGFGDDDAGGAGFIALSGTNDVAIANSTLSATSIAGDATSTAGNISISSTEGSIALRNNARLTTSVENSGFAGNIDLSANNGGITLRDSTIRSDFITGDTFTSGGAGFIRLRARNDIALIGSATDVDEEDASNTRRLRTISASTFGSPGDTENVGTIRIRSAEGDVRMQDARIVATASGEQGTAGDIVVISRLGAIAITDNSRVRSDATGTESVGGSVRLQARNSGETIIIDNSRLRSDATGDNAIGGEVIINGGTRIRILNNAIVRSDARSSSNTADGIGSGFAGNVTITAPVEIFIQNSRVTSTSENDEGDTPGNVTVRSRQGLLTITGTVVSTTNTGGAIAGDIELDAPDVIRLLNSTLSSDGREGIIFVGQQQTPLVLSLLNTTLSTTNASALGQNSGDIEITAGTLFTDSTIVRTNAGGVSLDPFEGGSITINVDDTIELVNSRISSDAAESADGGSIEFNAGTSIVLNDSTITSNAASNLRDIPPQIGDASSPSSFESAQAVLTPALDLAIPTEFGNGGDISLTLPTASGVLLLENGSRISTNAGSVPPGSTGGNGGNITIDTRVMTAEILGNNDITANSVNNNGGIIDIIAPGGIFGMIQRTREDLIDLLGTEDESQLDPRFVPTSDITAISQAGTGLSGVIVLETPDVEPEQGNLDIPSSFDNTPILTSACNARLEADTTQRSEFVRTGRGGIPIAPNDPIDGSRPISPWVERSGTSEDLPAEETGDRPTSQRPHIQNPHAHNPDSPQDGAIRQAPVEIIEAQGWRVDATGKTVLVAQQAQQQAQPASEPSSHSSLSQMFYPSCMPSSQP